MAIDLGPWLRGDRQGPRRRLGWLLAGPRWAARRSGEAVAADEIARGGWLIGDLAATIRQAPRDEARLVTQPDGQLDADATAVALGVLGYDLEQRWQRRRRQTARVAWGSFAAGWAFLTLWAWQMLAMPWVEGRVWAAVQVLPFCATFFVLAFRSAWQNWQLRTRRLSSVGDYLRTTESFWPSAG